MRFLLDHDVDAEVGRVLREAGHQCFTAGQVGLATANDDEVSVFADNRKLVVITHDQEFIKRRRANTFGKHVWLACTDSEAADVAKNRLPEILDKLNERDAIVIRVPKQGEVTAYPNQWK